MQLTSTLNSNQKLQVYTPGLHILAELKGLKNEQLSDYKKTREFFYMLINKYHLNALGEVFHNFENGGFTGIICLTESHLAIHTWPEFGIATFDVFLSNYRKSNDHIARAILDETKLFFNCIDCIENEISR